MVRTLGRIPGMTRRAFALSTLPHSLVTNRHFDISCQQTPATPARCLTRRMSAGDTVHVGRRWEVETVTDRATGGAMAQEGESTKPWWKSIGAYLNLHFHDIVLNAIAVCFILSPVLLPWIRGSSTVSSEQMLGNFFIFFAGVVNLVALIDICPTLHKGGGSRFTRGVLTGQVLVFAVLIGLDVWVLFRERSGAVLVVANVAVILVLIWAALTSTAAETRAGGLVFGLVFASALYIVPANLGSYPVSRVLASATQCFAALVGKSEGFIADRRIAWVHLVVIPLVYLVPDILLGTKKLSRGKPILLSKESIPLDIMLLVTGVACMLAGFMADQPLFEQGASAAVLLLGNYVYVYYVRRLGKEPRKATGGG